MANSSGAYMNALISDQEDAQAMINAINEFVSSSTEHLKGEAYDAVRAHLQTYIPILEMRIKTATSIMEAIKSANNSMIDYMEEENVLDTNELDGLYTEYNSYTATAQDRLNSANVYVTPEAKKQAMSEYEQYARLARKTMKKIQLLEGLVNKDNSVYSSLSALEGEITAYKNAIGDINPIRYSTK
jgi:RNA binding exosome subunit